MTGKRPSGSAGTNHSGQSPMPPPGAFIQAFQSSTGPSPNDLRSTFRYLWKGANVSKTVGTTFIM